MLRVKNQQTIAERGKAPKTCESTNVSNWTSKRFGDFVRDRSGAAAIIAAASFFVIMATIAGAVEFARYSNARTDLRNAVDTAVLAAAREFQRTGDFAAAQQIGSDYLKENTKNIIPLNPVTGQPSDINTLINISLTGNGTTISATGSVDIENNLFSGLGKVNKAFAATGSNNGKFSGLTRFPLFRGSGADEASATLRVGSDSGRNIEISLMLDVTGSMRGSRLTAMKEAAKNLINTVIWDDQSEYTSRVALVPFSDAVDVSGLNTNVLLRSTSSGSDKNPTKKKKDSRGTKRTVYRQSTCVVERMGAAKNSDVAPTNQDTRFRRFYSRNDKCYVSGKVTALSSNKELLKQKIDALTTNGYTAGHLGTAWAWYMLSPNFAAAVPSESEPLPYPDLSVPVDERETRKYAIIMTDGEYNIQYCANNNKAGGYSGVTDKHSWYNPMKCTAPNGSSVTQARTLCENMKNAGIEVYSIGFQINANGTAAETMRQCASSTDHVFLAATNDQLNQAYADIAVQIAQLYLSK